MKPDINNSEWRKQRAREFAQRTIKTCRKCGGEMKSGMALAQTFTAGMPDFEGESHVSTFSAGGPGKLVAVKKCSTCGWSVSR